MSTRLRDKQNIFGLPDLSPNNAADAEMGNTLAAAALNIATDVVAKGGAVTIENPATSYPWHLPGLLALVSAGWVPRKLNPCMFGGPWQKPTTLL